MLCVHKWVGVVWIFASANYENIIETETLSLLLSVISGEDKVANQNNDTCCDADAYGLYWPLPVAHCPCVCK